jgi:hypothetical protein
MREGRCQLRDTVPPTPIQPARHTPTDTYPTPARDDTVTSDQWSVSSPSPPALCSHPHRCATIPSTATPSLALWEPRTTRHRHTRSCASSGLPSAAPSSQCTDDDRNGKRPRSHPRSRSWTDTGLTTTPAGSKIRQDNHQLHGAVHHTTARSLRTVWHDCKPPSLGL